MNYQTNTADADLSLFRVALTTSDICQPLQLACALAGRKTKDRVPLKSDVTPVAKLFLSFHYIPF